jgi:hypothetical protein
MVSWEELTVGSYRGGGGVARYEVDAIAENGT